MRSRSLRWIALLAAVVLLLLGCDGSDDAVADTTRAATTTTAAATTTTVEVDVRPGIAGVAFDFSTQSLCDWFSAEDITQIVTSTYKELGVQPVPGRMAQRQGVPGEENLFCEWVADSTIYVLLTTDFERTPVVPFGPHAALDDSVRVSIQGDGNLILVAGLDALLVVDGHDQQLWFGHTTPDSLDGDVEMINTVGLTIANKMLKDMGWIESK